jgi:lysophospholipase L1-like esterase
LSTNETLKPSVVVQNLGIIGYTSKQMLDHIYDEKTGVCAIIEKEPYRPRLIIILAGTNDLVQMADTSLESARDILQSILDLHQQALSCNNNVSKKDKDNSGNSEKMHTLAIGIPGSYTFDTTPVLASRAKFVNDALKSYSSSTDGARTDYFDFPFPYVENDVKWHADGTHMTEEGYIELGKALAPKVKEILDGM